jgi:HK97 family phage major capsid protein
MNINELKRTRAQLINEARALSGKDGEFSAEDQEQFDRLLAQADSLDTDIQRMQRLEGLESTLRDTAEDESRDEGSQNNQEDRSAQAVDQYLRHGLSGVEYRDALQTQSNTGGGYWLTQQMSDTIIQSVTDMVFLESLATVETLTNGTSLGIPTLNTDLNDADWTSEIQTVSEDSSMVLGKREMVLNPLSKLVKESKTLLRVKPSIGTFVSTRLAYKFATAKEAAYMTGNGVRKPLGVFVASDNGIGTSRDVSTGNSTTAIVADNLIENKYNLKAPYLRNAKWIFHRDAMKQIAKLKDSDNQYLWLPSLRDNSPDMLLGMPVMTSEFAPNTFSASAYVGILGDFRNYWIINGKSIGVQRLDELFALSNQVGLLGYMESDGAPVLAEAFTRVKLAAS